MTTSTHKAARTLLSLNIAEHSDDGSVRQIMESSLSVSEDGQTATPLLISLTFYKKGTTYYDRAKNVFTKGPEIVENWRDAYSEVELPLVPADAAKGYDLLYPTCPKKFQ